MGGISSVYVRPGSLSGLQPHENVSVVGTESNVLQLTGQTGSPGNEVLPTGVLELRVTSPFPADDREEQMGRTIQYLAEENVRLRQQIQQLQDETKALTWKDLPLVQPELIGETLEQKVERLEKSLAVERADKWTAIEKCETYRVDFVNADKSLQVARATKDYLETELSERQRQISDLEVIIERLKSRRESDFEDSESSRESSVMRESTDMAAWRAQLKERREARQKAIAAKSMEMNQLREEVKRERALREKIEREVQRLRENRRESSGSVADTIADVQRENDTLVYEVTALKKEIQEANSIREENSLLIEDVKRLNNDIRQLNTTILQQDNDLKESKRKHDRLIRDQETLLKEQERYTTKQQEIEEEQQKMWEEYDNEKAEIDKRTAALKDVIEISRQMLLIREKQVVDLKQKLRDIEESLAEKQRLENTDLKIQYEKQLENIKALKALYEERVQLMEAERTKLNEKISDDAKKMETLKDELSDLTIKYELAGEELDSEKQGNIGLTKELDSWIAQARSCERELALMNRLLTQMLIGPNGADLDKLTELLQQNHALITEMTTCDDCSDVASALPKLLLDLIAQVEESERKETEVLLTFKPTDPMTDSTDTISEQSEALLADNAGAVLPIVSFKNATVFKPPASIEPEASPDQQEEIVEQEDDTHTTVPSPVNDMDPAVQEIVTNLPKVWKVLTELLSHHSSLEQPHGNDRNCYKNIDTPNGPRSVISVSNTFLRLKDLILEKKSLTRELSRLKHLNSHLETRLDDQEKRLSQVQSELHKTWGVVGRMRAQHQQLHNHEKILRYELQEKRVMLSELKQELEYCRDKWERARRKNNESEIEWKKLRKEFTARKARRDAGLVDSGESGFSDGHNESGEEADRSSTPSPIDFIQPDTGKELPAIAKAPTEGINAFDFSVEPPGNNLEDVEENSLIEPPPGIPMVSVDRTQNPEVSDNLALSPTHPVIPPGDDLSTQQTNGQSKDSDVESFPSREIEGAAALIPQPVDKSAPIELEEVNPPRTESTTVQEYLQEIASYTDRTTDPSSSGAIPRTPNVNASEEEKERAREARALRLQRLEEQCQLLVRKVDITSHKSKYLSSRLEQLHEQYGSGDVEPSDSGGNLEKVASCSQSLPIDETATSASLFSASDNSLLVVEQEGPIVEGELGASSIVPQIDASQESEKLFKEDSTTEKVTVTPDLSSESVVPEQMNDSPALEILESIFQDVTGSSISNFAANTTSTSSACESYGNSTTDSEQLTSVLPEQMDDSPSLEILETLLQDVTSAPISNLAAHTASIPSATESPGNSRTDREQLNHELAQKVQDRLVPDTVESNPNVPLENCPQQLTGLLTTSSFQDFAQADEYFEHLSSPASDHQEADLASAGQKPEQDLAQAPERDTSLATFDERMAARAERLKRLEEQCSSLFGKVSNTVQRSHDLNARLVEIHEGYVNAEARLVENGGGPSGASVESSNGSKEDVASNTENVEEPIEEVTSNPTEKRPISEPPEPRPNA